MITRYAIAVMLLCATLFLSACAGRQEEAARLEREILSQDTAISLAVITRDSQNPSDGTVETSSSSGTVPQEEQLSSTSETDQASQSVSDPAVVNSAMDSVLALVAAEQPVAQAEAMPRRVVEGKYTIQIAASASEEYALRLVDLYTQRGYDPYIDLKVISDVAWYRVRIGHFESVGEAAAKRDELINRYSLQAWVDNIPQ